MSLIREWKSYKNSFTAVSLILSQASERANSTEKILYIMPKRSWFFQQFPAKKIENQASRADSPRLKWNSNIWSDYIFAFIPKSTLRRSIWGLVGLLREPSYDHIHKMAPPLWAWPCLAGGGTLPKKAGLFFFSPKGCKIYSGLGHRLTNMNYLTINRLLFLHFNN